MRQTVLFTALNETVQVKQIVFAGNIREIEPERRKNEHTHAFKIITRTGAIWCYFKDFDSAKKIRGALSVMLDQVKGVLFKSRGEALDPEAIVSFSKVMPLKPNARNVTHGFVVVIDTLEEKSNKLWFTYNSEDHAEKARKALFASLMESNGVPKAPTVVNENTANAIAENAMSFN